MPAVRPPIRIGPSGPRLRLGNWSDLEEAAREGLLDEHIFVELKLGLPPSGKNAETARDLASFGVLGGVLVVGIRDEGGGKAGEVSGVDNASGVRDRLTAVADGLIQPPLPCEIFTVEQPGVAGSGCVVCVIPPSALAPHRADERYWGRGSTGKRVLSDQEIAALFADRRNAIDTFRRDLHDLAVNFDPIPADQRNNGHLYLAASPKQPPLTYDSSWTRGEEVLTVVQSALSHNSWPDLSGLHYSAGHPFGLMAQSFPPGEQPADETAMVKMLLRDDGTIHLVSGLGSFLAESRGQNSSIKVVVLGGIARLVDQFVRAVAAVADRRGLWGSWTLGIRMTDLRDAQSHDATYAYRMGRKTFYPEDQYERVVEAATSELQAKPPELVQRLLQSFTRGLSADHVFPYTNPSEL